MTARKQEIEVTISPDGQVSLRPKGAKGADCLNLTRAIEQAVGEVERREFTSEYYERGVGIDAHVRGRSGGEA